MTFYGWIDVLKDIEFSISDDDVRWIDESVGEDGDIYEWFLINRPPRRRSSKYSWYIDHRFYGMIFHKYGPSFYCPDWFAKKIDAQIEDMYLLAKSHQETHRRKSDLNFLSHTPFSLLDHGRRVSKLGRFNKQRISRKMGYWRYGIGCLVRRRWWWWRLTKWQNVILVFRFRV